MPSASHDGRSWIIKFKRVGHVRGMPTRKVRLAGDQWVTNDQSTRAAANALAAECERYCRVLEVAPTPDDIRHAVAIRAITVQEGTAIGEQMVAPPTLPPDASQTITIEEAAREHPATRRQPAEQRWEYLRYVREFCDFAGIRRLCDLRLTHAMNWLEHLRTAEVEGRVGYTYATRKHRLMYIRRAAKMGAALHGLPDPLSDLVLDREEHPTLAEGWTLDELAIAFHRLRAAARLRPLAVLCLGGFLGLRPSEMERVLCSDPGDGGHDDALPVGLPTTAHPGQRTAKNRASRRLLPMPATVAAVVHAVRGGRPPLECLLVTRSWRGSRPFSTSTWAHWLTPILAEATGRRLEPRCLRHSFLSWAGRLVDPRHADALVGHANPLLGDVSNRHYWRAWLLNELRPSVARLEQAIGEALARTERQALDDWDSARLSALHTERPVPARATGTPSTDTSSVSA